MKKVLIIGLNYGTEPAIALWGVSKLPTMRATFLLPNMGF